MGYSGCSFRRRFSHAAKSRNCKRDTPPSAILPLMPKRRLTFSHLSATSPSRPAHPSTFGINLHRRREPPAMESAPARRTRSACVAVAARTTFRRRRARHAVTLVPGSVPTTGQISQRGDAPPGPVAFATCVTCPAASRTVSVRGLLLSKAHLHPSPKRHTEAVGLGSWGLLRSDVLQVNM